MNGERVLTLSQLLGQVVFYGVLIGITGYLSVYPETTVHKAGETDLKLVIRQSGRVIGKCEVLTSEQLKKLPPNMQRPMNCPREKSAVKLKLLIDNEIKHQATISPSGIHSDGNLARYEVFTLEAGTRHVYATATSETHEGEFVEVFDEEVVFNEDKIVVLQLDDQGFKIKGQLPTGD